jgi:hypothetical protein
MRSDDEVIPGEALIAQGLADLAAGKSTHEALLVAIGAPRLRWLGVRVPDDLPHDPEDALYRSIERESPRDAHSRYNAMVRRLVSYEHALEAERGRDKRAAARRSE